MIKSEYILLSLNCFIISNTQIINIIHWSHIILKSTKVNHKFINEKVTINKLAYKTCFH